MKKDINYQVSTNYYSPLSGVSVPIRFDPSASGFGKYKGIIKFILINTVNIFLIIATLILVSFVQKRANNTKILYNEVLLSREMVDMAVLEADLAANVESINNVKNMFLSDETILDLIKKTDELRILGLISKFDILSSKPVRDGALIGYPVEFEIVGSLDLVNSSIKQIQQLPFLGKTVQIEIDSSDENQIKVLLGIFYYAKN